MREWKLTGLGAHFIAPEKDRRGQGIVFLCPICSVETLQLWFANPLDGGEPVRGIYMTFVRKGEGIEDLELSPAIELPHHGYAFLYVLHGCIFRSQ